MTQSNNHDAEGIFCFAELMTKNGIFKELIIESVEKDNAILMEINILQLKTALRGVLNAQMKHTKDKKKSLNSTVNSNSNVGNFNNCGTIGMDLGVVGPELTIRLRKMNGGLPHLCLDVKDYKYVLGLGGQEIPLTSNTPGPGPGTGHGPGPGPQDPQQQHSSMIGVYHAIPVRMMRVEELQHHVPPRLSMPDVQLELPRDRPIKNVVERLRMISPHGEFVFINCYFCFASFSFILVLF